MTTRRALQGLLVLCGVVAVVFGALAVLAGTGATPGSEGTGANVDSEFRYFASWYVVAGVLVLRAARAPERSRPLLHLVAGGLALGAGGRAISWAREGRPDGQFVALLVVEATLAVLIVALLRRVTRAR